MYKLNKGWHNPLSKDLSSELKLFTFENANEQDKIETVAQSYNFGHEKGYNYFIAAQSSQVNLWVNYFNQQYGEDLKL